MSGSGGAPPAYATSANPHVSISHYPSSSRPPPPGYAPPPPHYAHHQPHPYYHLPPGPPASALHPAYARLPHPLPPSRTRLPATTTVMPHHQAPPHSSAPPQHSMPQARPPQQQPQLTPQQRHYQQLQGSAPGNPPHNLVYIFSTELANSAAKAVEAREVPSLIEYHKAYTNRSRSEAGTKTESKGQGVKKEISSPLGGGGSASSGYESSATPPMQLQTSQAGPPVTSMPSTSSASFPMVKSEPAVSDPSKDGCNDNRPLPSPQSVPPPPKTPMTPLGRANSVNPTGNNGPSTPQSVPPPMGNGPGTPSAAPAPTPGDVVPSSGPASVPPPSSSFSVAGDDPLSKMARLANESLPMDNNGPPSTIAMKRPRVSDPGEGGLTAAQIEERSMKMRRLGELRKMMCPDAGAGGPPQQQQQQQHPQHMQQHPYPHHMAQGPGGPYGHPMMMMDPNYGPPRYPGDMMMMRPPTNGDPVALAKWEELVESHRAKQAEAASRARAPRPPMQGGPRASPRLGMRMVRPPPYGGGPPPDHHLHPAFHLHMQQQQQHRHPMMMHQHMPGAPQGSASMTVYNGDGGLPHHQPHHFPPGHPYHTDMGGMVKSSGEGDGKPTVNNTYVNATMSIQQLNIQNLGPPLSCAPTVHASGAQVSLSMQTRPGHPPPQHHYRHPHPSMSSNGDLSALFGGLAEQPITNLDSKVPSKTLSYRPAPPEPPPPASSASAPIPDFAGLLGPGGGDGGEDSFGFDNFDAFTATSSFGAFNGPDSDLTL